MTAARAARDRCPQRAERSTEQANVIIAARPYDDAVAQRLVDALYAEQMATYGFADPPTADSAVDYVQSTGLFLVASTCAGEAVACGGYRTYDTREAVVEVRKMFVRPDWRGHGIGRVLLTSLERHAISRGRAR